MRPFFLAAVLLCAAGCSSVVPALRDRTNALLRDYRSRAPPDVAASAVTPRAWKPGQYVVFSVTRDGEGGLLRYAVDEQTKDGVWISAQELTFRTKSRWRVLLREPLAAPGDAAALARRATVQADGQGTRVYDFEVDRSPVVAQMRDAMAPVWAGLAPPPGGGAASSVQVPAGRFEGARAVTLTLLLAGQVTEVRGQVHDAVPLNALVQARSADGAVTVELVEFGDDDAGTLF